MILIKESGWKSLSFSVPTLLQAFWKRQGKQNIDLKIISLRQARNKKALISWW